MWRRFQNKHFMASEKLKCRVLTVLLLYIVYVVFLCVFFYSLTQIERNHIFTTLSLGFMGFFVAQAFFFLIILVCMEAFN